MHFNTLQIHDLRLGSRTDTRHGKTNVDSGTDTTEEKLSFQEDLTIGNRNDLVRNRQRIDRGEIA